MAAEIGKVWVRVVPNTTRFRSDLRKALERVERTAEVAVSARLDTRKFLSNVRDAMRAGQAMAEITARVDAQTAGLKEDVRNAAKAAETHANVYMDPVDNEFRHRLSQKVAEAVQGVEAAIPATVEGERLRRELQSKVAAAQRGISAEVPVDVEQAAGFRANLHRMVEEIEAMRPAVTAHAETAGASAELAEVSRTRSARIIAVVDTAGIERARSLMMGLSGGRVVSNLARGFMGMATNLDTLTPKISLAGLKIAGMASAAISTSGNLLTLVGSLSKLGGLALAAPGIFSAFAMGMISSFEGLQNSLLALYDALGTYDVMGIIMGTRGKAGEAFWANAIDGFKSLVTEGFYPLLDAYVELTGTMGKFWGAFFNGLTRGLQAVGGVGELFVPLNESVEIAAQGIDDFMEAMVRVGAAGGQFLPPMAQAFTDMSNRFLEWTKNADMTGIIQAGIDAAKDLGRVFGNVFGIIGGVARAAGEAGGVTLGKLADGLGLINQAVNGPAFQGALVTVFSGANQAMKNLAPVIQAIADAFVSLAPTISQVFQLAGDSISMLMQGISKALQRPELQQGVVAMFQGIHDGVKALAPVLEDLGPKFGAIAETVGTFARTLGPVLGAGLQAFAPVLEELAAAAQAVIPVLGAGLVDVFNAIAPVVQWVAGLISGFAQQFPGLTAVIVVIAGVLGTVVGIVSQLAAFFGPIMAFIGPLMAILSGIIGFLAPIVSGIASLAAMVGTFLVTVGALPILIGAILAALVVLVVTHWEQISSALQTAWDWIVQIVQTSLQWVQQTISTVLSTIAQAWTVAWQAVGNFLAGIWTWIKNATNSAINWVAQLISSVVTGISNTWNSVWSGIGNFVSTIWSRIRNFVSAGINFVRGLISAVMANIGTVWSLAWGGITSLVSRVWTGITSGASNAMRAFGNAISQGISNAIGFFRDLPGNIWNMLSNLGDRMRDIGHNIMVGLWNGIVGMANRLYDMLRGVVKNVIKIAKGILGIHSPSRVFRDIGSYTGQGMILGLEDQAARVQAQMTAMVTPPAPVDYQAGAADATTGVEYAPVSLDGARLRLETDAGTVMARLVNQGDRRLQRA